MMVGVVWSGWRDCGDLWWEGAELAMAGWSTRSVVARAIRHLIRKW